MPDMHPQINILSSPSTTCINPVGNCIQYCFEATDFAETAGATAFFSITFFDPSNYADGIPIEIAGKDFQTGTPTTFEQFQWTDIPALTIAQMADNVLQMLSANFSFLEDWTLSRSALPGLESVNATSRKEEAFSPFTFSFPVAIPPLLVTLNGTTPTFKKDYQIVVQIWDCDADGVLQTLLSQNSFEPSTENSEVCVDISRNVSSLVQTTWNGLIVNDDTPLKDTTVCRTICLRYGQIFDEGATDCDVTPQYFEPSSPITIINSVFQKPEEAESIRLSTDLMDAYCYQGAPTKFLTDYPQGLKVCPDSCFWLLYNLDIDFTLFTAPAVSAFYRFFYTDGSISPSIQASRDLTTNGCWQIPAGECQLSNLSDPLKVIEAIETTIILIDTTGAILISESFLLQIDRTECCCKEFYFLNEKGGFDLISLNCEETIALELESSEVCGYENCTGDILQGGKAEADRKSFEVYKVFTQFNEDYLDLNWFRQFLKSPIRYVRQGSEVFKIKLLSDSIPLFTFEEKTFLELEYVLSFELNTQE
jgi:hypothetical protein